MFKSGKIHWIKSGHTVILRITDQFVKFEVTVPH